MTLLCVEVPLINHSMSMSHASWKVLEFCSQFSRAWKVLENKTILENGPGILVGAS
jgi:hypothetical protein